MTDREIVKITGALGHPIRISFVRAVRVGGALSPVQFSRDSGEALGNVSYHVKALERFGVLTVAALERRRGATEHRYALEGKRATSVLAVLDLLDAI